MSNLCDVPKPLIGKTNSLQVPLSVVTNLINRIKIAENYHLQAALNGPPTETAPATSAAPSDPMSNPSNSNAMSFKFGFVRPKENEEQPGEYTTYTTSISGELRYFMGPVLVPDIVRNRMPTTVINEQRAWNVWERLLEREKPCRCTKVMYLLQLENYMSRYVKYQQHLTQQVQNQRSLVKHAADELHRFKFRVLVLAKVQTDAQASIEYAVEMLA